MPSLSRYFLIPPSGLSCPFPDKFDFHIIIVQNLSTFTWQCAIARSKLVKEGRHTLEPCFPALSLHQSPIAPIHEKNGMVSKILQNSKFAIAPTLQLHGGMVAKLDRSTTTILPKEYEAPLSPLQIPAVDPTST